jgi:putative ABC transport system permease protein
VAIVNEALARAYFPGVDPIGRRLRIVDETEPIGIEVVGIAGNVRSRQLQEPPRPEVYVPRLQAPVSTMSLMVRAAGDPAALTGPVQRQIAALDPALAAGDVFTSERLIAKTTAPSRLTTGMLAVLAVLALLIAAIGIYGVISFGVVQRTHEIGVRVALGARRANVLALIVGQGAGLALAGVVLGLAGALALSRGLRVLLYGVSPTDPLIFTSAAVLLAAAALLASYLPARRAAGVDPILALRQE